MTMAKFNPFAEFEERFLPLFKQKGIKAFVKQTYDRGRNMLEDNPRPAFLLTHTEDLAYAQKYFDEIKGDPNRDFFIITEPEEYEKLKQLLHSQTARYYTILTIKDANAKAQKLLDARIRFYVNNMTNWRPKSMEEVVFSLDIVFGEIYVKLKHGSRELKIKLDDLEDIKPGTLDSTRAK